MERQALPPASAPTTETVATLLAQHAAAQSLGVPACPPGGLLGLVGNLEDLESKP